MRECVELMKSSTYNDFDFSEVRNRGKDFMKFEKLLKGGLAALMAMSMVACSGGNSGTTETTTTTDGGETTTETTAAAGAFKLCRMMNTMQRKQLMLTTL